jgi:predicted SAM-dependent methyltransferase
MRWNNGRRENQTKPDPTCNVDFTICFCQIGLNTQVHYSPFMISRRLKQTYYTLLRVPLKVSGSTYRLLLAPRNGVVKVHLGPGQRNYIPGWYNVDANLISARIDVWADLRDRLPFRSGTVDAIYSHHVMEHLPESNLPFHFSEMFRCLKPGGIIRVGGPNGDTAMRKFVENDASWFSDFPDKRASIGGKLSNFLLCRGEHLAILTESFLREIAEEAGFTNIKVCSPCVDTLHGELIGPEVLATEWESTPEATHTLLIEAEKPR